MKRLSSFERTIFQLNKWSDDGKEVTPVPIPNTEVKLFSADGSWGLPPVRVGRRFAQLTTDISVVFLYSKSLTIKYIEFSIQGITKIKPSPKLGEVELYYFEIPTEAFSYFATPNAFTMKIYWW